MSNAYGDFVVTVERVPFGVCSVVLGCISVGFDIAIVGRPSVEIWYPADPEIDNPT